MAKFFNCRGRICTQLSQISLGFCSEKIIESDTFSVDLLKKMKGKGCFLRHSINCTLKCVKTNGPTDVIETANVWSWNGLQSA